MTGGAFQNQYKDDIMGNEAQTPESEHSLVMGKTKWALKQEDSCCLNFDYVILEMYQIQR